MAVRGERAGATRQRILDVAREQIASRTVEFTLGSVAAAADVSVQTILRAFGSKEGLIVEAVVGALATAPAPTTQPGRSVSEAVTNLFDDYEEIGDRVIWLLAEEHRIDGMREVAEQGRTYHRTWVDAAFGEQLATFATAERKRVTLALIAATDVYVWKLLRRDLGLQRQAAESIVERLVRGALVNSKGV